MQWHTMSIEAVLEKLGTNKNGITNFDAEARLKHYGLNKLKKRERRTALIIFYEQFKSILVLILVFAMILSLYLKTYINAAVIGTIIILNAFLGLYQEFKAEREIEALKKLIISKVTVIRDEMHHEVSVENIVPGDIVILEEGNRVPADIRLIEVSNLKIDESELTGESVPVLKETKSLKDVGVSDRKNMAFMSTLVSYGRGKGVVVATGMSTEIGNIATLVEEREEPTPLQVKLQHFGKDIGIFVVVLAFFIFLIGLLRSIDPINMLLTAMSLAVAAVPEGLPAVVTLTLAIGAQRMLKRNSVVKRLAAVEALGSVTMICVPGDTPIICNPSIKSIDSINIGEKVLGIDGNFHLVAKTFKRPYVGKIVSIKPLGLPMLKITPEHPILVAKIKKHRPIINRSRPRKIEILEKDWISANDVKKDDMLLIPRIKIEKPYTLTFNRGRKSEKITLKLDEELAELFGWYLAEGCTSINKGSYEIILYLGKKEQKNIERIKYLIEKKLGLKAYIYEKETAVSIIAINKDLVNFLRSNFGERAENKRIPDFILNSPKNIICRFLEAYLKGDGDVRDYYLRFHTTSKTVAYQLIILLAKIGIRARLHKRKGGIGTIEGRIVNVKDSYVILINGTQASIIHPVKNKIKEEKKNFFLSDENYVYVPVKEVKTFYDEIDVYNIETSSQTYALPFIVHNCADKTGTMTTNEMTVEKIWYPDKLISVTGVGFEPKGEFFIKNKKIDPKKDGCLSLILKISKMCNDAILKNGVGWHIIGDPTEGALKVLSRKANIEENYPRVKEIPFSSERKIMTTIHDIDGDYFAYAKGAPEFILKACNKLYPNKGLDRRDKEKIIKIVHELADDGLRVLACAYKKLGFNYYINTVEENMTFAGLVAMMDPPRKETKNAIRLCKEAGIKVIMLTGDHPLTAKAVASQIGLSGEVLTGEQLDKMTEEEFEDVVDEDIIFARVSPQHKLKIVEALKKKRNIVAVTGDGVNDAPALKKADIGVAMGIKGTDVAKESADIILLDDNFHTIVSSIEEGRRIYDNIKKFIRFLLSANFDEMLVVFSAVLLGLPIPFLPTQILWMNLITDSFPALSLGVDPKDKELMQRKPRSPRETILHSSLPFIIISGLLGATLSIIMFMIELPYGLEKARTMAFTTTVFYELFFVFNCRSEKKSVFQTNPFSNKKLVASVVLSILLQLVIIYVPFFQPILETVPLGIFDWAKILAFSSLGFLVLPQIFMRKTIRSVDYLA